MTEYEAPLWAILIEDAIMEVFPTVSRGMIRRPMPRGKPTNRYWSTAKMAAVHMAMDVGKISSAEVGTWLGYSSQRVRCQLSRSRRRMTSCVPAAAGIPDSYSEIIDRITVAVANRDLSELGVAA